MRNPSISDPSGVHEVDPGEFANGRLSLVHTEVGNWPPNAVSNPLSERLQEHAQLVATSGAYIPRPPVRVSPAPPISTIAGTTVMITPQQRYEYRLDFGKRISHLTLTERDALELIQRLRQSIAAARKAQQVTP